MSQTYDIACAKCKVKLWFGQYSNRHKGIGIYDYKDENGTNFLARFLLEHQGCSLVVEGEHVQDPTDTRYIEYVPGTVKP